MKYIFKLVVTVDDDMGFDSAEIVKDQIEEALRDAFNAGLYAKLVLVGEEI